MIKVSNDNFDIYSTYFSAADKLKKKNEQKCFELSKSPHYLTSVPAQLFHFVKEDNKVTIKLPPLIASEKNLIYVILNTVDEPLLYLGKTEAEKGLRARISGHLAKINGEASTKSPLYSRIFQNPEKFAVGILYSLVNKDILWPDSHRDDRVGKIETKFIQFYLKNRVPLANKQLVGGGGGRSQAAETPTHYAIPKTGLFKSENVSKIKKINGKLQLSVGSKIFEQFKANRRVAHINQCGFGAIYCFKKYTPLAVENRLIEEQDDFAPSLLLPKESVKGKWSQISESTLPPQKRQEIESTSQVNGMEVTCYVGRAGEPDERIEAHLSKANSLIKKKDMKLDEQINKEFYLDLIKNTHQFTVEILPIIFLKRSEAKPEQLENYDFYEKLGPVEKHSILAAKKTYEVYNKSSDSRGSYHSSLCGPVFPIEFRGFD